MNVLITGGAGFIGSALLQKFTKEGHEVTVFDSLTYAGFYKNMRWLGPREKGITEGFFYGDLRDINQIQACFQMHGPFDLVIHAAAESSVDRSIRGYEDFVQTNVMGSCNLFQICKENNVPRVINFATDEIYGHISDPQSQRKFDEHDRLNPRNIYSASKAAQMLMANAFYVTHGLRVIHICPSNCYGPRQHAEKLIPKIIYCLLSQRPVPLYNQGKNLREWLYVWDAAEAIYLLSQKGEIGETYNIGGGQVRSVWDVYRDICWLMEKPHPEESVQWFPARPGDDFCYQVDSSKILKDCGWEPKTKFKQGLEETVSWYLANKNYLNFAARRLGL